MQAIAPNATHHTPPVAGAWVLRAVSAAVSFESVLVLYLFSGQFKGDARFAWLPVDATLLLGVISVAQGVLLISHPRFRINHAGLPAAAAGVLFAAYAGASVLWSTSEHYAQYKAAYIATMNTWGLFAAALVVTASPVRFRRFCVALLVFAGWMSAESLLFYAHHSQFGRVLQITALGGETAYIGLSRVVTLAAVVCAVMAMLGTPPGWRLWRGRRASLLVVAPFAVTAAMIGARGPIVAAVLAVGGAGLLFSDRRARGGIARKLSRVGGVAAASGVLIGCYRVVMGDYPLFVLRFMAFSRSSEHYDASGSSMMRLELYSEAIRGWLQRPLLGHGSGGYAMIWGVRDERLFPHNLFLELLCEFGVVGAALFAMIAVLAIRSRPRAWSQTPPSYRAIAVAATLYALANTMTSGDLPDNRFVFVAIGLLAFRAPELSAASQRRPPPRRHPAATRAAVATLAE